MHFKIIDHTGKEQFVDGLASLLELVNNGYLDEDTLVFDAAAGRWRRARDFTAATDRSRFSGTEATGQNGQENESSESESRTSGAQAIDEPRSARKVPNSGITKDQSAAEGPALPVISPQVTGRPVWWRWSAWLRDDETCYRLAVGTLMICGFIFLLMRSALPNTEAAEKLGHVVGYGLGGGVFLYLFLRRGWGTGHAMLISSLCLFCLFGYLGVMLTITRSNNEKVAKVMFSAETDIRQRVKRLENEIQTTNLNSVSEMLEGKRESREGDIHDMLNRVTSASVKTDDFITFFEARVSKAKTELSLIDRSAGEGFSNGLSHAIPEVRKYLTLQRQHLDDISELLIFLLDHPGQYQISRTGITFRESRFRDGYNAQIDKMNKSGELLNKVKTEDQGAQNRK